MHRFILFFWVVSNSDEFYFNLLLLWVTNFFISLNIILWTICFDAHSTCFHFTLKLLSTNFSCSEQYWNWRHQPPPFLVPIKSTNSLRIGNFLICDTLNFKVISATFYLILFGSFWDLGCETSKYLIHSYCNFKTITKFLISLNHIYFSFHQRYFFDPLIYIFIWHYPLLIN